MLPARITRLDISHDGVILVTAVCQHCRRTVMHGAGFDPDALVLGTRVAHCRCGEYELTDVHGIVPEQLVPIRAELAARAARKAAREERRAHSTRREIADGARRVRALHPHSTADDLRDLADSLTADDQRIPLLHERADLLDLCVEHGIDPYS